MNAVELVLHEEAMTTEPSIVADSAKFFKW
jgi:hypothetical protein